MHLSCNLLVSESVSGVECPDAGPTSPRLTARLQQVFDSDLVKDGISSTDHCSDVIRAELHRLNTVLPTMWIGAHSGRSVTADLYYTSIWLLAVGCRKFL